MKTGIIIVDHGSRNSDSNRLLDRVVAQFARRFHDFEIVEPAHMELAEPDLATAYARCVRRGADLIVVVPFFLAPGKHMTLDIPRLVAAAACSFPHSLFRIAPPLGIDELMLDLLAKRAGEALLCEVPQS